MLPNVHLFNSGACWVPLKLPFLFPIMPTAPENLMHINLRPADLWLCTLRTVEVWSSSHFLNLKSRMSAVCKLMCISFFRRYWMLVIELEFYRGDFNLYWNQHCLITAVVCIFTQTDLAPQQEEDTATDATSQGPVICPLCPHFLPSSQELRKHLTSSHPGYGPYKCHYCSAVQVRTMLE